MDQHKNESTYKGRCFCGAVEIAVTGDPVAAGYCHCSSCRLWSASPVNAFTLWQPDSVKVIKGAGDIGTFNKTDNSFRQWCTRCGGHLMNQHPRWGLIDVYAAVIPDFPFRAGVHVNYQEAVLRIHDGLPKQKDVPAEMGGSNTLIAA
jgi:hypothetical protein